MSSVFYDKLVNIHDLHIEFDRFNIPVEHRNQLMKLADSAVHHEIFDLLMIEIPAEHRTYFLELFAADPSDPQILVFIKHKVPGIEDKISERAGLVKESFAEEVRKLQ